METARYGGDTSAVEVVGKDGRLLVLDAGSGMRALGANVESVEQVDVLITHLHMDHIQGLPFFAPLHDPDIRVDVWGPISTTQTLKERLNRYLSPPLFPVRVRDLSNVAFHDVPPGTFDIDGIQVTADLVSHPGPTLGYRLEEAGRVLTYLPDHEPALGMHNFPKNPEWTSGYDLAAGADLLIHDSQYTDEEYSQRIGWGHSSYSHVLAFAAMTGVGTLMTFHHDPDHGDQKLDEAHERIQATGQDYEIVPGTQGAIFEV
ncbi:MAG TPA: MBL fold metallo-hydrolase [Acidimicrobiia bacterium]|nr:MBL fold metallo-hydrolase [Acidimicrobiia bacterium]